MLRRRLVLTGLAVSVVGARAWAVCPALQPPTFYAYQSDAATVELVVVNTTLAGIDHWSVSRTETGGSPVLLFPNRLSPSTTSITDQGQGLQAGHSYSYTLTATDVNSMQTSYTAAAHDVGNRVDHSLNPSTITLGTAFGFDPRPGGTRLFWGTSRNDGTFPTIFPSIIGPLFPKYIGSARHPATNAALACATVTVNDSTTGQPATLWADRYGNFPHPNPMTADRHGTFEFYTWNGTYDLSINGGTVQYSLTSVTIFDARSPDVAHGDATSAMTLVTSADQATADGNIHLKITRPNSTDGNDAGDAAYRLLANESTSAWAVTYNLGVDEQTNAVNFDADRRAAFFFRVNAASRAMEFGIDPAYATTDGDINWISRSPLLETLLHVGPDRAHFKSLLAPVGVQATAGQNGIASGNVVAFQPDGTVALTTTTRQLHPYAVLGVDEASGSSVAGSSRVFLSVGGRSNVWVRGVANVNDPLTATSDGYAQPASAETDARYILGYAAASGGVSNTLVLLPVRTR
ncbi:MAG: hypothetical protein E6J77_28685 [Deltaproteobacteria bacterium]|nr:MAG: hypothetical protein E6J77_28685 [Deltaproteobacteria bacterium]